MVASPVLSTTTLNEFVRDFHASGFGAIRHAIEPTETVELRDRLTGLLPHDLCADAAPLQRSLPRLVERHSCFAELASRTPLLAILRSLFGGVVPQLVASYGHEKPARTRAHTGPHSDVAHLSGVPHHLSLIMVKAMYALTPVRPGFGETVIYPRSHRWSADDPTNQPCAPHHVQLDPGDLLLFHSNVRHTATDNLKSTPRLSLWYVYALPWMRVFPGYEYREKFLADLRPRTAAEPHLAALYGLSDPYSTSGH